METENRFDRQAFLGEIGSARRPQGLLTPVQGSFTEDFDTLYLKQARRCSTQLTGSQLVSRDGRSWREVAVDRTSASGRFGPFATPPVV